MRPFGARQVGLLVLVLAGLAFAFYGIGLSGVPTPAEELENDTETTPDDAFERFASRLNNYARLQAVAFGMVMAGVALVMVRLPGETPEKIALVVALLGAAVVSWARLSSLSFPPHSPSWDVRLGMEAMGWAAWAAALALLGRRWLMESGDQEP